MSQQHDHNGIPTRFRSVQHVQTHVRAFTKRCLNSVETGAIPPRTLRQIRRGLRDIKCRARGLIRSQQGVPGHEASDDAAGIVAITASRAVQRLKPHLVKEIVAALP